MALSFMFNIKLRAIARPFTLLVKVGQEKIEKVFLTSGFIEAANEVSIRQPNFSKPFCVWSNLTAKKKEEVKKSSLLFCDLTTKCKYSVIYYRISFKTRRV